MTPKVKKIKPNLALLSHQDSADFATFLDDLHIKPQCRDEFFHGVIIYRIRKQQETFNAGNTARLADRILQGYGERLWSSKSKSHLIVGQPDEGQGTKDSRARCGDKSQSSYGVTLEKLNYNTKHGKERISEVVNGLFKALYEALIKDRVAEARTTEEAEVATEREFGEHDLENSKASSIPIPGPNVFAQLIPGNNDDFNTRGPDGKLTPQATRLCVLKCQEIIHFLSDNARLEEYEAAFADVDSAFVNEDYTRDPAIQTIVVEKANNVGRIKNDNANFIYDRREEPFQAITDRRVPALDYESRLPIGLSREPWLSQGDPTRLQLLTQAETPRPKVMHAWINVSPEAYSHPKFQTATDTEISCGETDMVSFFDKLLVNVSPKDKDVRAFVITYGWCSTQRYVANHSHAKKAFWEFTFQPDIDYAVKSGVKVWRLTVLVITNLMWGGNG